MSTKSKYIKGFTSYYLNRSRLPMLEYIKVIKRALGARRFNCMVKRLNVIN